MALPTGEWLQQRIQQATDDLERTLADHGAYALGPAGRALAGITEEPCKCCRGRGRVWMRDGKVID